MSPKYVEAVKKALDAWNRGDVDGWIEAAHPEVEWYSAIAGSVEGVHTVYRGREALRRYWDEWHAVWDVTVELSDIHDLGDIVLALGRMRTRGVASGIDLESPVGYVFRFDGGLIRSLRAYRDQQEALKAVGLRE